MKHPLNPSVDLAEHHRQHPLERRFIEGLRNAGRLIEIGNVHVDAERLVFRAFQCNTSYCVKCSGKNGLTKYQGSCCTDLQVDLTEDEKRRIEDLAARAKANPKILAEDSIREIVGKVLAGEVSETDENHDLIFKHREDGRCVMSWLDGSGQLRCSINTMVERLGLAIEDFKPNPCYHFPLHYLEYEPGVYLMTLLSEETRHWAQQHRTVTKLICLRKPEPGAPSAYLFLRREIEHLFGEAMYAALDREAQAMLARADTKLD